MTDSLHLFCMQIQNGAKWCKSGLVIAFLGMFIKEIEISSFETAQFWEIKIY